MSTDNDISALVKDAEGESFYKGERDVDLALQAVSKLLNVTGDTFDVKRCHQFVVVFYTCHQLVARIWRMSTHCFVCLNNVGGNYFYAVYDPFYQLVIRDD